MVRLDQSRNSVGNTTEIGFKGKFAWEIMGVFWWEPEIKDADTVGDNEPTLINNEAPWLNQFNDGISGSYGVQSTPKSDGVQLDSHITGDQELMNNWSSDDVQYDPHISGDSELIRRQQNKAPYDAHFWG